MHCYVDVFALLFRVICGVVFVVMLFSLHCYMPCIICCRVMKEAGHEFREGTSDLSKAQSEGLEIIVEAWGLERGSRSYEEPFVESVLHA